MPPMCATCRWYDPLNTDEGHCRAMWTYTEPQDQHDPIHITWPLTTPTARCSEWATQHPTRLQQTIQRAQQLLKK